MADFDSIRSDAAGHAACPICLDSLAGRPGEVGALTSRGRRVEAALYHRSCVGAWDGRPRLPGGLSPITRGPVDGWAPMPPLCQRREWLRFVDWNGDGAISVAELSSAVAAMMPVCEEGVERYVRETFGIEGDAIPEADLLAAVLPHLEAHAAELAVGTPRASAPALARASTRQDFLAWFRHWDGDGSGSLDAGQLRFALAALFFRALGDADVATKEAVVAAFLGEAGLDGGGQMTKNRFLEQLVPALQANLPEASATASGGEAGTVGPRLRLRLLLATSGAVAEVELPAGSSLGDLRRLAQERLDPSAGVGAGVEVLHAGRRLDGPAKTPLADFPALHSGAVVQVLVRPAQDEPERLRRAREEVAREREALRLERERLSRAGSGGAGAGAATGGPPAPLVPGTRVVLRGLRAAPELNGRRATVLRFEAASGRYVVHVDGPNGGQKSLRPEALEAVGAAVPAGGGVIEALKGTTRRVVAHVQVWAAGYETWQLLLGAGLILLFALAFFQVNGGYSGGTGGWSAGRRTGDKAGGRRNPRRGDSGERERWDAGHQDKDDVPDHYDDYGTGRGYSSSGGGGLLSGLDQTSLLLLAAGFGYLCWKGVIPIQRLDFFQCAMLWSLLEPLLFSGRRRRSSGYGYGGLGGFGMPGMGMGFGRRGFMF